MSRKYVVEFREALLDKTTHKPYAFLGRIYSQLFATAKDAKAYVVTANATPRLSQPFPNVYAVAVYVGRLR